jgi:hypothetical protein
MINMIVGLLACGKISAPVRSPAETSSVEIRLAKKPDLLKRGETGTFALQTSPKNTCIGAIGYTHKTKHEWITFELIELEAGSNGICEWTWKVPLEAGSGIAEFRGAAIENGGYGYLVPQTFCIEVCPWNTPDD